MSFSQQIAGFSQSTITKLQRTRRGVILKLFSAVILDTPVLTGRLRGAWKTTEGAPAEGDRGEVVDPSGALPIAEAAAAVAKSEGDIPVYLTNNLPYAARIEFEGWSHTKAPQGMVRRNVARFNRLISIEAAKNK